MDRKNVIALAGAAALGFHTGAFAAPEDDLRELRDQLRQIRDQYEKRIEALERRIDQAEKSSAAAQDRAAGAEASAQQAAVQASSRPSSESAFNPAVSLILNGTYGNLSRDPGAYPQARGGYRINGFAPTMGEVRPPLRGPSLGESELAVASNIDHNFRGTGIFALAPDDTIAVEEAYVNTLSLPRGFTLKAGRFFSGVGYLNEIHAHAWDFTDVPLTNKAFLGNQLAEDGLQLRWIAPTETYLDVGLELGRGRQFPSGPAGGRNKNGFGSANVFTHLGGDIGAGTAWQVGLSHLRTSPEGRTYDDLDSTGAVVSNSFSGSSRLWALSGVLKWAPNGNPSYNNFKLQGEYFRRDENGMLAYDTGGASRGTLADGYSSRQSGYYLQSVYQFAPRWRIGYRYDRLDAGTTSLGLVNSGALTSADFPILSGYNPTRNTLVTDWSPSEFSRIRLQLARDNSRSGQPDNQVFVQYIMSLGAHGAHKF
jgi:hypothetical protein